jgi:hypothetical protein
MLLSPAVAHHCVFCGLPPLLLRRRPLPLALREHVPQAGRFQNVKILVITSLASRAGWWSRSLEPESMTGPPTPTCNRWEGRLCLFFGVWAGGHGWVGVGGHALGVSQRGQGPSGSLNVMYIKSCVRNTSYHVSGNGCQSNNTWHTLKIVTQNT